MKTLISILIIMTGSLMLTNKHVDSIYEFTVKTIHGDMKELSDYRGHVLLIVNTASECGFTSQYEGLQLIYEKYRDEGFYVLGFPANNFGGQEPGTDEEIMEFCTVNFNVSFPMFSKLSVKGDDIDPLFDYLTNAETEEVMGEINWNFEKFLIDQNGNLEKRFRSRTAPTSEDMTTAIENLLRN